MKDTEKDERKEPAKPGKTKLILILLGAGVGIFLLLLGSGWFTKQTETDADTLSAQEELALYRVELERRIADLCAAVSGVSQVHVSATLSGGFETVYATETRNGVEVYATIGSGSSAKALVIAQNPPEVTGIGVVCRGGNDPAIRGTLTALLSSAFRVPTNRISIAEAG